jgi:hypothetical protein
MMVQMHIGRVKRQFLMEYVGQLLITQQQVVLQQLGKPLMLQELLEFVLQGELQCLRNRIFL